MKRTRINKILTASMLAILAVFIVVPVMSMNHESDVISDIDNRKLAEFEPKFDAITTYFSDRIGFRKEMIGGYSLLNDRLFHVMEHPTYEYGDNGYVFFKFEEYDYDYDFVVEYADFVAEMNAYCASRDIPFIYVISPEKSRVYHEYVPSYIGELHYSANVLTPLLDERGVKYVDQYDAITMAKNSGIQVFNKVYDAGHWNTEGMYAGSQAVIDAINETGLAVDNIDLDDYHREYEEQTTLPASYYPIDEMTYKYIHNDEGAATYRKGFLDNLIIDENYHTIAYYESEYQADAPSLLMFQGSYYNTQGTMLENQFSQTAQIHDYENVFYLPYYVDVFQPDVVVFENADYTITGDYYQKDKLTSIVFPPTLQSCVDFETMETDGIAVTVDAGNDAEIVNYSLQMDARVAETIPEFVYVEMNGAIYDTIVDEDGVVWWGAKAADAKGVDSVTVYLAYPETKTMEKAVASL